MSAAIESRGSQRIGLVVVLAFAIAAGSLALASDAEAATVLPAAVCNADRHTVEITTQVSGQPGSTVNVRFAIEYYDPTTNTFPAQYTFLGGWVGRSKIDQSGVSPRYVGTYPTGSNTVRLWAQHATYTWIWTSGGWEPGWKKEWKLVKELYQHGTATRSTVPWTCLT